MRLRMRMHPRRRKLPPESFPAMTQNLTTWQPGPRELDSSGIVQLMRALGVATYEELLALSTTEPARYWEVVMRFCAIQWHKPPSGYVDLGRGREFPRWFRGGQLNWVETAFAYSRHPATASQPA